MTDAELLALAAEGRESAVEELLTRYKSMVTALARRYFLVGGDAEDLVQEGMIALYRAIGTYDPLHGGFAAYAGSCVKNRMLDAIKSANRDKHRPLNDYVPFPEEDELPSFGDSPEEIAIAREGNRDFAKRLDEALTDGEKTLLGAYLAGRSYKEMAASMSLTVKQVDASLQKLKKKILKLTSR